MFGHRIWELVHSLPMTMALVVIAFMVTLAVAMIVVMVMEAMGGILIMDILMRW